MNESDALARISAQATDAERAAVADVVIENSGTVEELRDRVNEVWESLDVKSRAESKHAR